MIAGLFFFWLTVFGFLAEPWVLSRRPIGSRGNRDSGSLKWIFLAQGWGLLAIVVSFIFLPPAPTMTPVVLVGLFLSWSGLALRWIAIRRLGPHFTYEVSKSEKLILVQDGIYRHIRHPSYLGLVLFYIGLPLTTGRLAGWLYFTLPCLVALSYRLRIEERVLVEVFGFRYADYARKSAKLIPLLW